jgi:hypothetical protein
MSSRISPPTRAHSSRVRRPTSFSRTASSVKKDYVAHEATGEERTQWWDIAVAAYPPYAEYQTRTDRQIPVFVLVPKA